MRSAFNFSRGKDLLRYLRARILMVLKLILLFQTSGRLPSDSYGKGASGRLKNRAS